MELKEKLVDLRKKKGLSQVELADAINVSRQAISRWEVGSAIPSADNLMWLSKFYEVSMDELMDISVDGGQEKSKEKPVTKTEAGIFHKSLIFIFLLAGIMFIVIWAIFSMHQGTGKDAMNLGELENEPYLSGDMIDMDIKFGNS